MEYRVLQHGGEKIGIIGLGMAGIRNADAREAERMVRTALDAGVNVIDYIPSEASAFEGYIRALSGANRSRALLQVHIGAEYTTGKYGWTTDAKLAASEFERRLRGLNTDYADFGFIHCIDEDADFEQVMNGGIWDYACRRKDDGTIRHLAFSTHTTSIARKFLARVGDELAADHYRNLERHASDCVQCGHCDSRCPFGCAQSDRMAEIADYFGI